MTKYEGGKPMTAGQRKKTIERVRKICLRFPEVLVSSDPEKFFAEESYRMTAPKRLVSELDTGSS